MTHRSGEEYPEAVAIERSAALMAKYAERPMDLADATLVALAEARNERRIFTLDDDVRIYRLHGRRRVETVWPT